MKQKLILLICSLLLVSAVAAQEKPGNWIWLFNGKSTDAWRTTTSESFPEQGWKVSGKEMTVLSKTETAPAGKDIITKEQFGNFELELECRLTEGANSGIKYFVVNTFPGNKGNYLGLECQLIDNERHEDAKLGRDGNRKMASLYDLIPAKITRKILPPGKWNKIRIIVNGSHVEHWLNGEKVLEFNRHSNEYRELVRISKYNNLEGFGEHGKGHILLQGHSDEVSFRNIRIREIIKD